VATARQTLLRLDNALLLASSLAPGADDVLVMYASLTPRARDEIVASMGLWVLETHVPAPETPAEAMAVIEAFLHSGGSIALGGASFDVDTPTPPQALAPSDESARVKIKNFPFVMEKRVEPGREHFPPRPHLAGDWWANADRRCGLERARVRPSSRRLPLHGPPRREGRQRRGVPVHDGRYPARAVSDAVPGVAY
jgi:hypothetical protein